MADDIESNKEFVFFNDSLFLMYLLKFDNLIVYFKETNYTQTPKIEDIYNLDMLQYF